MMQQLVLLKRANIVQKKSPFLTGPTAVHDVKKVHFGLAHLHLLNLINVYTTFSPAAYCIHFAGQLQAL